MKLDFSSTNFKAKVTGWRLSIENKADTLFPAVCDTARGIAGITAATATADLTQLEHQDPQILARANLASEDEDSAAEHDEDNTQAIDEDHDDKFNEHRDNGVDDGQEHNNGGDDLDGHDNEGDDSGGDGNEGDNRIGSKEGEDNSKESLSYCGPNDSNDGDNDETEEDSAEASDLTEIGSSSDVEVIPQAARGSGRKGVKGGRH